MFAHSNFYFRLQLPLIIIHITCISLSLCRTSAPIHLISVLGVLGTQKTSCILIVGLLERDIFDLFLPKFDKPWVIHLRDIYCCSTNLCTWRPNTVYKNRSMRRHHSSCLQTWQRTLWLNASTSSLVFSSRHKTMWYWFSTIQGQYFSISLQQVTNHCVFLSMLMVSLW
jgi:hypothetical protein